MIIVINFFKSKKTGLHSHNKDYYRTVFDTLEGLPVFFSPWWLDHVCGKNNWDLALSKDNGGNITGILPYFRQLIKGISVLSNPPLTPYLGAHLFYPDNQTSVTSKYSFENKTLESLISQLPKGVSYMNFNCTAGFDNWYPFYWQGYEQSIRYTYLLDLEKSSEEIFSGFNNTLKRQIKKAAENLKIHYSDDWSTLYDFLAANLKNHNQNVPLSRKSFGKLFNAIASQNHGKILEVRNEERVLAAVLLVWDELSAYCLVLGMDKNYIDHQGVKLLLWSSIKEAAKHAKVYDFEGSMLKKVERIFRSYGGTRTPYYNIRYYRNKWIKVGLTLFKK